MDIDIKVEKGIEVPLGKHQYNKWPFNKMKVGDSFLVPLPKDSYDAVLMQARIYTIASRHKERGNGRFTVRFSKDGWRVWKVEE